MQVELPIAVQTRVDDDGSRVYRVQPLFDPLAAEQDRQLYRATNRLVNRLAEHLSGLCRLGCHREVADYLFHPDLTLHRLKLQLVLRRRTVAGTLPVITFKHLDRQLVVSPLLPDVWFELRRGDTLQQRASDVYTAWFRSVEKQDEDALPASLEPLASGARVWLDQVELEINTRQHLASAQEPLFALLGGPAQGDGPSELERVGRCLDRLYPEELQRFRDPPLTAQVERLLGQEERRPVLLVGPAQVGKTALIHDVVRSRVQRRKAGVHRRRNTLWLLSPQRLISGMSYVGQWENRLLAILKGARKYDQVLCFDDMLGLYRAGVTSQSTLSVADVLKPYVQRGEVRVLAEITPPSLRVWRERDRGFADLFQIVHVEEPTDRALLPILLDEIRLLETHHACQFDPDVLPTAVGLTRRYLPDAAYPGKVITLLRQLAERHVDAVVDRETLLAEFHMRSGLDLRLLDPRQRLAADSVRNQLQQSILGQPAAIDALVDVVLTAKAGLNAVHQPLGTLLFIGPTGVGKTESAKALARFLFSDEDRLIRFDMNEYVSAAAVTRLMGTFDQPDGLLTSGVRERPYGVLLLDEIEKAHPHVFDLLLQVLGEARLTDARGRTVNFSNMIIIMTSNLGTREAVSELGFSSGGRSQREVYLRAVREFFRPEFLNRLDRVVPFENLGRDALTVLAEWLVRDVLDREGFRRRSCALEHHGEMLSWVTEQGYHPALGARAMKRAVEQHVVSPVANHLAATPRELPTVVTISRHHGEVRVDARTLREAEPRADVWRPAPDQPISGWLRRAEAVLDGMLESCRSQQPGQVYSAGQLGPKTAWFLAYTDACRVLRGRAAALQERLESSRPYTDYPALAPKQTRRRVAAFRREWQAKQQRNHLKEMVAAREIHDYLAETARAADHWADVPSDAWELQDLLDGLALLHALQPTGATWTLERALVLIRRLAATGEERDELLRELLGAPPRIAALGLEAAFWPHPGRDISNLRDLHPHSTDTSWAATLGDVPVARKLGGQLHLDTVLFEGFQASRLLSALDGTYLFTDEQGQLKPVQLVVLPIPAGMEVSTALADCLTRYDQAMPGDAQNPLGWKDVVAVYARSQEEQRLPYRRVLDFRAGLTAGLQQGIALWDAWCATLPLPPELEEE